METDAPYAPPSRYAVQEGSGSSLEGELHAKLDTEAAVRQGLFGHRLHQEDHHQH